MRVLSVDGTTTRFSLILAPDKTRESGAHCSLASSSSSISSSSSSSSLFLLLYTTRVGCFTVHTTTFLELFLSRLFLLFKEFEHAFLFIGTKVWCFFYGVGNFQTTFFFLVRGGRVESLMTSVKTGSGTPWRKTSTCHVGISASSHRTGFGKGMAIHIEEIVLSKKV